MGAKAKIRTEDGWFSYYCPGCHGTHEFPVTGPKGWKWNGSLDVPTISPSILVTQTLYGPDRLPFNLYDGPMPCEGVKGTCHSFVENGMIRFLDDCFHELAGKTVEMEDIDP